MESPESARKSPNEEETSKASDPVENHPESLEESSECSEKVSGDDVKIQVATKTKRVSFHFGTNSSESEDVVLSTIQNIYDSKTATTNEDNDANLVRDNSTRSRINKSAYIKLHRHSFSSAGNSSVDKLKGRYENIAKQTDNNLKPNTFVRAKANTDNNSTNNAKNSDETNKHVRGEQEEENTHRSKSESLKAEFINPQPQNLDSLNSTAASAKSSENLLLKTTSNIEKLQNNLSARLSVDTIEKLRSKYSPASFGYPRDTKLPKKVQFAVEQHSRIPVPTPRVSLKAQHSEELKKEDKPKSVVVGEDSKGDLEKFSKPEEIKTVTVKLVSVPENLEQTTVEKTSEKAKDENSNLVSIEDAIGVTKSKPQPPAIPPKQLFKEVEKTVEKAKDENSNLVSVEETTSVTKSKPQPPAIPPKKLFREVPAPETITENLQPKQNEIEQITSIELEVTYDNIEFAEPEDKHFIVRRSSSEDSVDKVENFFSEIVMEKKSKENKRSNSFRKILTGGFFGRDRKKSDEEKTKQKKKDNAVFADNAQNESQAFDRNSSHRHTIDNVFPRREVPRKNTFHPDSSGSGPLYYYSPQTQLRRTSDMSMGNRYTEMKGSSFASNNHPKYSPEDYVPMDNGNLNKLEDSQRAYMNVNKYIDTSSSSSNTLESESRNCTYQNALIAQAEMRQIRENENLQRKSQRSDISVNPKQRSSPGYQGNRFFKHSDSPEMFRESPPRPQDSSQNLQLVKPKALIPINSERPLPNPYHNYQDQTDGNYENLENGKTLDRNLNIDNSKPFPHKNNVYGRTAVAAPDKSTSRSVVVEDVYGTVFDSITPHTPTQSRFEYFRNRRPKSPPQRNLDCSSNRAAGSPVQTDFLRTQKPVSPKPRNLDTQSSESLTSRNLKYSNAQTAQGQVQASSEYLRTQKLQSPGQRNVEYVATPSPQNLTPRRVEYSSTEADQSLVQTNSECLETKTPQSSAQKNVEYSGIQSHQNLTARNLEYRGSQASPSPVQTSSDYLRTRSPQSLTDSEYLRTRSLSPQHGQKTSSNCSSPTSKISTSPKSLEASKLKLPSNREKVELQPRIRSPIPQAKISTDKIIATELLRTKRSPTPVQEKPPPKHASPTRPASYQGTSNIDNNLSSPVNRRVISPNAQSSPQSVAEGASNDYIYLNSPVLKNKPPPSPREASVSECLQAAEWQRQQRELDKSPALKNPQQITTDAMVHANPEEERYGVRNNYTSLPPSLHQRSAVNQAQLCPRQAQLPSPIGLNSPLNNERAHTPIQQAPPSPSSRSPEKQHMLQNVEAFYWRELRKLKDKEEQDLLKYRQQQLYVYGYVEDPVFTRRSRSVSPSMQRGRRSLSLPRDVRSTPVGRGQLPAPEAIPEGRPVIAKKPIALPTDSAYGQVRQPLQRNPNFIRNTFERSTIGPIGVNKNSRLVYENYHLSEGPRGSGQRYTPIFKRGSLTANVPHPDPQLQGSKKVSFSSTQNSGNVTSWPTKNGFTKSPPTRRIERESMDDDVFLPSSPRTLHNRKAEEIYVRNNAEVDSKQQQIYQNVRRDVVYVSQQPRSDHVDRRTQEGSRENMEALYGRAGHKQVTVSNKVCDIYGQIHDSARKPQNSSVPQNYGQIRQIGYVYGQIQPNSNKGSPVVLRQSYNHLSSSQSNFVRGTRLTASVNDMYKRYPVENPRYEFDPRYQASAIYPAEAPHRPLPPVPERRDSRGLSTRKTVRGYVPISDTESGSEAGEVQRILQSGTRQKHFSVIEEEWNSDGKSGRASGNESGGSRGENEGEIKSGRSRSARREDPRRHTLSGDQHYTMAGQGGPLSRTMDLEGQFPRGYPPSSNAMLFDDDPGIMSEVETSSTGFRRGGKQRSSLPVVRTPSKTLERPLGLVFLQYRNETKRALLPNEITSIDTVKALFVRSFPKQLSMEYLDSPLVKIYIHDSSKDMFYELEDVRSHLREIRDRSVLRLFESTDVSGGLPMGGVGIPGGIGHFEDPSYFSEPEFDSEYQHQHIHKSKGSAAKGAPYYMGSTTSLPRGGPLLRPYSPAVGTLPPDRIKTLPAGAPPKPQRAYSSGASRASDGSSRPPDRFAPFQRPANPLFNLPDGYMSSPERGSRGYEDPYYSQYTSRSGSITPVIDEEVSDTELLDEQYSLYGVKLAPGGPRGVRSQFPGPAAPPYDTTRLRVEHMERQLANLTGLVQKALTQTPTPRDFLAPPGRDAYRSGDEFDKNSSSSSASLPDDSYLRSDSNKAPKLGKTSCHKSVSFEKSVSFSDEPPDMNSPKQHSPQHAADTKPPKPAIKSSTLPRTSSQEKDRLKPAPPPKPASLSPGQYDGRHIYRDLQLTPEMYNQLRGLQKKAKDLRAEVRNLRRMSQAQAHSVRETIRDTFIKIRAMLMAGGEQVWQAGMDQERVRLSRDEDLYKQEMLRLEKDLTDLEASVEELRGNVINRKTRVNMSDVENMALVLSKSSKTVADLKLRFPGLQDSMKAFLSSEMDKVVREEKFLKEEPERLESALRRCKKLTGTLVTLKRLASVQEQRLPCSTSAADGRISPSISETPPVTPTSAQHSKPPSGARVGQVGFGGDSANTSDSNQRPENALDALLDELQTFSKPHPTTVSTQMPQASYSDSTPSDPPAIPVKGIPPSHSAHFGYPHMAEIGRKGSMDSASILPTQNLTVSTTTGSLRRLHSYPSGSDTDNSPPIQPLRTQMDGKAFSKPPIPERNAELLQHIASGRRVPPPPPPRTSSKSPLASPTSPSLPPRSPAAGLQHIQNVQNMTEKPQSQFEAATQNLGLSALRRNVPNRSSMKDNNKAQTLPRNIGSNLQVHTQTAPSGGELQNVSSSSCESVNSQDGTKKGSRKEELEQRHQELLKKQKALQEQYARLQQLQRGNNTLAVVPPAPDQLLKKTGSESNLLQKMGLQMATTQMTGSLTHLPSTATTSTNPGSINVTNTATTTNPPQFPSTTTTDTNTTDNSSSSSTTTTSKVYETDIL